jgi:hypothetical protein
MTAVGRRRAQIALARVGAPLASGVGRTRLASIKRETIRRRER